MNMIENSAKSVRLNTAVVMPVGLFPLKISNPMRTHFLKQSANHHVVHGERTMYTCFVTCGFVILTKKNTMVSELENGSNSNLLIWHEN